MGRLPTEADFPSHVNLSIVPPPDTDPPTNLLLLHGLGDTHLPFHNLGRQLHLPETVCLSLCGPSSLNLLDLPGFHWGDDVIFDSTTSAGARGGGGGIDADAGFTRARKLLKEVVLDTIVEKCGFTLREVAVLGFGQGGMAALDFAASLQPNEEMSGIISIGAGLPSATSTTSTSTPASGMSNPTPILICAGQASSSSFPSSAESTMTRVFSQVEIIRYRRPDDGMPRSREEMLPLMRFWGRRLRSVRGVPGGAVEMT